MRSATPRSAQPFLGRAPVVIDAATALYAVPFRPNADGPALSGARSAIVEGRIATVQLRWEDPDSHQVTEAPMMVPATSTPGTWRKASRALIPATNWPLSSLNTPNCCATAPGRLAHPPRSWSSRPTACHRSCGMIRKWSSLPAWSAGPARSGRWGISGKLNKLHAPNNYRGMCS